MAVADNTTKGRQDWKKRESLSSALIQVLVVGAVLAGVVWFVVQRGQARKDVTEALKEARATALRDNPKDIEKALASLDEIFKVDDSAPEALALAADLQTELWLTHKVPGADAKAKDLLAKAEKAGAKSEERFGTKPLHLIAEGKAAEAVAYAEDLRKQGASSAKLWYGLARGHQELGALALARQAYSQAADKAWKNPRYYAAFGEALLDEGAYDTALETLNKGLGAHPDHLRVRLNLALARLYKKDRVKDAEDILNEAKSREAELTPALKARMLTGQAELALFTERLDDALKLADEAVAVNADEHLALLARARALAKKNDPNALQAYQAATAKKPTAPLAYLDGAMTLQRAGNFDGAMGLLAAYENAFKGVTLTAADGKVVQALDRDDRFWITRGDVLRAAGKQDEAMAAYDKAVAANSVNLAKAHLARGSLLLAQKKLDEAVKELSLVTPEDGTGQLADAYLAMGEALFAKQEFAPGCQNFAFALARMKREQQPREKLNSVLEDVNKRLVAANQKAMAKAWLDEAKPIIQ